MEKGLSPSKAKKGMHRLVSGRSWAVLVGPILLSVLVFNHLKKKKGSAGKESIRKASVAEKESIGGASTPSFICQVPTRVGSDQYDVFLSFTGLDICKEFTDHLYHYLVKAGALPFCVSREDDGIPIGEEFGSQLLKVITQSKISIPIISEYYASSNRCLRELIHIMDCKKSTLHLVLPIFYKVDRSDVQHLKGNFGKVFHSSKRFFDEKDIEEGQRALREVCYLNGWDFGKTATGHGGLIESVVETVLSKLSKHFQLHVPKELVGLGDHMKEIMRWIDSPSINARMIGIYGMGGIGKTTLAKCIYNQLLNKFESASFLVDVREMTYHHGIVYLQRQLISDILHTEIEVCRIDDGISIIKSRFKEKKVLIFLDDIDCTKQLNCLAREHNWFGAGSIIIVTTRYEGVLHQCGFEVRKYELNEMDKANSLLLFNRHAFHMEHSPSDFEDISHAIVSTMGGLPLALVIIGSYLYKKANKNLWEDVLKQVKGQPHRDVQKILHISYDALENGHKEIFLDIASFFNGKEIKFAMYMWSDSGLYPSIGITELKLRCLIKIGDDGKCRMHDQLRDFGRSIVCNEPPERRSRLWVETEAYSVLKEKMGTEMIQAISLDKYNNHLQTYTNEQFENLQSLRFLQLRLAALSGDFDGLFSELRWLQWLDIEPHLSFLATNLHLPKLVVLQLSHNQITECWTGWSSIMAAKRLKVLDLAFCDHLRRTPDLSSFIKLEILILTKCSKLELVHPSIGKVQSLISLDLRNCYRLKELPEEVGELEELKELILDYTGITKVPMSIGSMRNLANLSASDCSSLIEIPSSIGSLYSLQHLNLCHCSSLREIPNSIKNLSSLEHLNLKGCKSLREVPSSIGDLFSLQHLNLQGCESLREVPSSIGDLSFLQHLDLRSCQFREIPSSIGDLQNLQYLDMSESSIEKLPNAIGKLKKLQRLYLKLCRSLEGKIPSEIGNLSSLEILEITRARIFDMPKSIQILSSLQHLSVWGCVELRSLPDFPSGLKYLKVSCQSPKLPNLFWLYHLEELVLFRCHQLEYIPELPPRISKLSVASCPKLTLPELDRLTNLEELSIENCNFIERLDLSQYNRLERLHASHCYKLVEIQGGDNLKFLEEIVINRCRSIERLILPEVQSLNQFKAYYCDTLVQIQGLDTAKFLEALDISDCESIKILPDLSCFATLRKLNIARCQSLEKLPNLSKFKKLENFTMTYSLGVMEIPGVEELRFLTHIDITGCKSMVTLPDLSRCDKLQSLVVQDCKKLSQLQGLEMLDLNYLDISGCASLESMPKLPKTCVIRNYEKER